MFSLSINFVFAVLLSALGEPLEAEGDYKGETELVRESRTRAAHGQAGQIVTCREESREMAPSYKC